MASVQITNAAGNPLTTVCLVSGCASYDDCDGRAGFCGYNNDCIRERVRLSGENVNNEPER